MAYSAASLLKKVISEDLEKLTLTSSVTLKYLSAIGQVKRGTNDDMYWDVITKGSTVKGAPMTEGGENQGTGDTVEARLSMGAAKFYHQFSVKRTDLTSAASAAAPTALRRLFAFHVEEGMNELRRRINQAIWTGDGSDASAGMIGLSTVMDNTKPYAGLDPTTISNWKAVNVPDPAPTQKRALTRDLLYDLTVAQEKAETYSNVYFANPDLGKAYQKQFDTIAGSYSIPGVNAESRPTDLGFNVRSYNGVPILSEPMMPDSAFVGLNTSKVTLYSYDLANADQGTLDSMGQKDNFKSLEAIDVGGLMVNIALMPANNPGLITLQMFVCPQLQVKTRKAVQAIPQLLV